METGLWTTQKRIPKRKFPRKKQKRNPKRIPRKTQTKKIEHNFSLQKGITATRAEVREFCEQQAFSVQKDITATRAKVREFREQQATMERRIIEAERQVARAKTSITTYHGPQHPTRSE
ncbi:unnamed protein product [Lactuca saligna]|uniref:Uncharacterized protein n=1 Tax=Lactuca saligna TaxID=75948 RepID=A0AA35Y834_LACSI|nr:unnamed protein product [Lactuca saligna]